MNNPFDYFDKIFVISAKGSERRQYITDILSGLNIQFQFFDANMGDNLSDEEIASVYDDQAAQKQRTLQRSLIKAEIGTTLSHLGVCKQILSQDLDSAVIFEDDIDPNAKYFHTVSAAISELPENWDLMHMGTCNHFKKAPLSYKIKLLFYFPFVKILAPDRLDYPYRQLWNIYPRPYSKNLNRAGYHVGSQAYAVSRSGAKKLLAYHNKIVNISDMLISEMAIKNQLNAFITKRLIFDQNRSFKSYIPADKKRVFNLQ